MKRFTALNRMLGLTAVASLAAAFSTSTANETPQLSDLPTLYITTEGNAPIISKEDYVRASILWVDANGTVSYDNNLGIRGRGNSTWGMDKKPYRIKFDKKTEFLGSERAKAKSWTLLANFADKSLIRNAVAACIGSFAGQPFTAAAEFVDVVLNGKYIGNYQISDQMEIRPKRVDITEQEDPATEESNITGGYFLEVDGFAYEEPVSISTPRGVMITVKSPDEDVINDAQISYIRNHITTFENALYSNNFRDPEKGYRKYVDASTLASWYISTELTGNVDGFWSTYIYKEKDDDKIYWGPLWDYDIAFNNCDRIGDVSQKLMTDVGFGDNLTNVWVKRMWQDPWFANLINNTWRQLVADGIEKHICDYIDALAAKLDKSQQLNFGIWPINRHDYNEIVLFNTYQEGIDYLKKFIKDHCAYLTTAFQSRVDNLGEPAKPAAPFEFVEGYWYRIANKGNLMNIGISDDGQSVCIRTSDPADESQDWEIAPVGDFYIITNRSNGLSITDVSEFDGSRYKAGTALALKEADADDFARQWTFSPIAGDNTFCMVSRKTSLAWNNSGGGSNDGNSVIAWNNDSDNASKPTRQWVITKGAEMEKDNPDNPDNPGDKEFVDTIDAEVNYQVSYIPEIKSLRFAVEDDATLSGRVMVYTTEGLLLEDSPVCEIIDLSHIPSQTVLVTWRIDGKSHTVKLAM